MYRPLLHIIELWIVTPSQSSQYIFWLYLKKKMVVSKKRIIIHTELTSLKEADILIDFNILYLAKKPACCKFFNFEKSQKIYSINVQFKNVEVKVWTKRTSHGEIKIIVESKKCGWKLHVSSPSTKWCHMFVPILLSQKIKIVYFFLQLPTTNQSKWKKKHIAYPLMYIYTYMS